MRRAHPFALAFAFAFPFASGCTVSNPAVAPSLDQPSTIYAHGATAESQVTVHRQGAIDPSGHDQTIGVRDLALTIDAGDRIQLERLELSLADVDLPPTREMPDGLSLRDQKLTAPAKMDGTVTARSTDRLQLAFTGSMSYATSMVLDDGSLYALGPSDATGSLSIWIEAFPDGTFDVQLASTEPGECATVGDLLSLSNCSLSARATTVLVEPN